MRPSIYTLKIISLFCVCFLREGAEFNEGAILMFIITNCLVIQTCFLSPRFLFLFILHKARYSCTLVKNDSSTFTYLSSIQIGNKRRFFKREPSVSKDCYLKTGIYPILTTFYSLINFIWNLVHRLPLKRIIFIYKNRFFVIRCKARLWKGSEITK